MTALEAIYQSIKHRIDISFNEFADRLKDWQVYPVTHNNEVFGGFLIKGNEIHLGIVRKGYIRGALRQTLGKIIKEHGFAVTSVQIDNPKGLNFCKRLGFVEISQDCDKILLRCDRSNHVS